MNRHASGRERDVNDLQAYPAGLRDHRVHAYWVRRGAGAEFRTSEIGTINARWDPPGDSGSVHAAIRLDDDRDPRREAGMVVRAGVDPEVGCSGRYRRRAVVEHARDRRLGDSLGRISGVAVQRLGKTWGALCPQEWQAVHSRYGRTRAVGGGNPFGDRELRKIAAHLIGNMTTREFTLSASEVQHRRARADPMDGHH